MKHRSIRHRRLAVLAVASLVCVLLLPAVAAAATPPTTWGVQPSSATGPDGRARFEFTAAPGATIPDYVGVSNFGDAPLTVHLYATDAFSTDDGGFALLTVDQRPTDVGSWVRLGEDTYEIPARKRLDIPFEVRVPPGAEPGDHIGGIVASVEVPATDSNGNAVIVDRRVGARIYLAIEGAVVPSLSLEDVNATYVGSWDPLSGSLIVTYTIRNTGNIRLSSHQRVVASGPFGTALKTLDLADLPELLPGASVSSTTTLTGVPPVVMLATDVRIEPISSSRADVRISGLTSRADAWALPVLLAGIVLLTVEALVGLVWLRRRRGATAAAERERVIETARAEGMAIGRAQADGSADTDGPPRATGAGGGPA